MTTTRRDDFPPGVKTTLAQRAAYTCSNPECRRLTVSSSEADPDAIVYLGHAAHITAAAPGGPRFDPALSAEERASLSNAIHLCPTCAAMIDKNGGIDHPVQTLRRWKAEHEEWARQNFNKGPEAQQLLTIEEGRRRQDILNRIRQTYCLNHDGLSAGMLGGTQPMPKDWVEPQLQAMGEIWRRSQYI